jgi:hypothetical protein
MQAAAAVALELLVRQVVLLREAALEVYLVLELLELLIEGAAVAVLEPMLL